MFQMGWNHQLVLVSKNFAFEQKNVDENCVLHFVHVEKQIWFQRIGPIVFEVETLGHQGILWYNVLILPMKNR